jgi:hypothetical protein
MNPEQKNKLNIFIYINSRNKILYRKIIFIINIINLLLEFLNSKILIELKFLI